eukprot:2542479-Amphidinium_carterae.1
MSITNNAIRSGEDVSVKLHSPKSPHKVSLVQASRVHYRGDDAGIRLIKGSQNAVAGPLSWSLPHP